MQRIGAQVVLRGAHNGRPPGVYPTELPILVDDLPVPDGGRAFRMHAEPSRILQIRRPDTEASTGVFIGDPSCRAIGVQDDLNPWVARWV